jgi:hypothetical protein
MSFQNRYKINHLFFCLPVFSFLIMNIIECTVWSQHYKFYIIDHAFIFIMCLCAIVVEPWRNKINCVQDAQYLRLVGGLATHGLFPAVHSRHQGVTVVQGPLLPLSYAQGVQADRSLAVLRGSDAPVKSLSFGSATKTGPRSRWCTCMTIQCLWFTSITIPTCSCSGLGHTMRSEQEHDQGF